jgi:hypothetical protein
MFDDDKKTEPTEPKEQQPEMQIGSKPNDKDDKDEFKFTDWASI